MPTPSWEQALTPSSAAEVRTATLDQFSAVTLRGWPDSAPQRALVELNATAIAFETQLRAAIAATASPSTILAAGPSWVDAAMSWFDLSDGAGGKGRIKATKAVWDVPLFCSVSAAPLVINGASGLQMQAEDGTIFELLPGFSVTLNAAIDFRAMVRVVARLAGTSGNVAVGQITKIISGPGGLGVNTPSDQELVTAARSDETDAQYLARGLGRWGTISIAGWTALSFDFLIPDAAPSVTKWLVEDNNPLGPGTTRITIATEAGPATAEEVAAVAAGLALRSKKTLGNPPPTVEAAGVTTVAVQGTVGDDGSNSNLLADIVAALAQLARAFPIGGGPTSPGVLPLELVTAVLIGAAFPEFGLPGFLGATKQVIFVGTPADVAIGARNVIAFETSGLDVA